MRNFPKTAQPVLDWIRRDVPRPTVPIVNKGVGATRWPMLCVSQLVLGNEDIMACNPEGCCPMGMLPTAKSQVPVAVVNFTAAPEGVDNRSVVAFFNWFDGHDYSLADELIDFIWPQVTPIKEATC